VGAKTIKYKQKLKIQETFLEAVDVQRHLALLAHQERLAVHLARERM
jgi:hypothetical protein